MRSLSSTIVPPRHARAIGSATLAAAVLAACVPTGAQPHATVSSAPVTAPSTSASGPAAPVPNVPRTSATTSARPTSATAGPTATVRPGRAVTTLASLTVKGRAPKTGYDRALFGQAWADVDRNGCDTRNDVLRRDLTAYTLKAGTNGCLVLKGTLRDPYTGRTISFVRGPGTSTAVQIDHVVALSDAWQKGAQRWTTGRRTAFANDPLNLLAVDGPTNERKGDGDAATWLPPRKAFRCAYVARQIAVKKRYGLFVTAAERDAMVRILETCPSQGLPTGGTIRLGGGPVQAGVPTSAPKPSVVASPGGGTDPRFGTCREAKAAGYGPYRRGSDPEYSWYRDADSDGIVCE
jgi:hypothetical protein